MTRLALAIVVTAAGMTALAHHQHKRPTLPTVTAPAPASIIPLRASRAQERQPLPGVKPPHHVTAQRQGASRPAHSVRRARPAPGSGLADVTMYCATGNRNAAGRWPRIGDVAVLNRAIAFGTRLLIAGRTYVVEDWIGSGSQFDIFGGDDAGCEQRALTFGRQHLLVEVVR